MNEPNREEIEELYQDIENLRQQIHQLEDVIAHLIHEFVHDEIYGRSIGDPLTTKNITSDRIRRRQECSQALIKEIGGPRKLIEIFQNLSENDT